MTGGARFFMRFLTRLRVTGVKNIPSTGPLILVGNHVSIMEVVLMCSCVPRQVEMIGVGDIPPDITYAPILKAYGYIPIKRGSMDRQAMSKGLDVLKQGGVIGIFPEGGIWQTTMGQARTGVSWLSSKANAPVVPIGFGGMRGAMRDLLMLKRPELFMNIGEPLPAVESRVPNKTRKEALADGADEIMEHVAELVPESEKATWTLVAAERFTLEVELRDAQDVIVPVPGDYHIRNAPELSKLFHRPVIIRTWARNLRLPVGALRRLDRPLDLSGVIKAVNAIDEYLHTNPHFLSYRFGDEGDGMHQGLLQLRDLAEWALTHNYSLRLSPLRHYRPEPDDAEIVERVEEIA